MDTALVLELFLRFFLKGLVAGVGLAGFLRRPAGNPIMYLCLLPLLILIGLIVFVSVTFSNYYPMARLLGITGFGGAIGGLLGFIATNLMWNRFQAKSKEESTK